MILLKDIPPEIIIYLAGIKAKVSFHFKGSYFDNIESVISTSGAGSGHNFVVDGHLLYLNRGGSLKVHSNKHLLNMIMS